MHLSRTEERIVEHRLNLLDYRVKTLTHKILGAIYKILQVYLNNLIPSKNEKVNTFKLWFYGLTCAVIMTLILSLTHQH